MSSFIFVSFIFVSSIQLHYLPLCLVSLHQLHSPSLFCMQLSNQSKEINWMNMILTEYHYIWPAAVCQHSSYYHVIITFSSQAATDSSLSSQDFLTNTQPGLLHDNWHSLKFFQDCTHCLTSSYFLFIIRWHKTVQFLCDTSCSTLTFGYGLGL